MFQVGQQVKVTDQQPPTVGVVKQVSTWSDVCPGPGGDKLCYLIFCTTWDVRDGGGTRWIDKEFVKTI